MNKADFPLYHYRGTCIRVVDGDTIGANLDLGMRIYHEVRVRILGYDAAEVVGRSRAAGIAALDHLQLLVGGKEIWLVTKKDTKSFDRWLAEVWYEQGGADLVNVAGQMIEAGYAVTGRT